MHEVAQAVQPSARVVYVDNDPIVLAHGRALLTSAPQGKCAYLQADIRDPGPILRHPLTRDTLDFARPVALILNSVLHFFADEEGRERSWRRCLKRCRPAATWRPPMAPRSTRRRNGSTAASAPTSKAACPCTCETGASSPTWRSRGSPGTARRGGGLRMAPGATAQIPPPADVGINGAVARKPLAA